MNFFSSLRIGRRLTVAFAVVVALTAASALFSLWRLVEVKSAAVELTSVQAERSSLAFRWRQNVAINGSRAAMLAMITDTTLAEPLKAKVKATSAETSTIQKRFAEQSTAFTPEAWSQFMSGQGLMGNYVEQSKNLFTQMQEQMQKQAQALFPGFVPPKK